MNNIVGFKSIKTSKRDSLIHSCSFSSIFPKWQYHSYTLENSMLLEKALKSKKDDKEENLKASERYTIFHALFEAMKDKDKKHKKK